MHIAIKLVDVLAIESNRELVEGQYNVQEYLESLLEMSSALPEYSSPVYIGTRSSSGTCQLLFVKVTLKSSLDYI